MLTFFSSNNGTKIKKPKDNTTKKETVSSLTNEELLFILNGINDSPEKISTYITNNNINKISLDRILFIASISQKHCEEMSLLEILKKHPEYKKIKQELSNMEINFQREEFYKSPK